MTRNRRHRKKPLAEILRQFLHYAGNSQTWCKEHTLTTWLADEKLMMAVAMSMQIVGEQANSLLLVWPDLLPPEDNELWEALRSFRHGISHSYDALNHSDLYYAACDLHPLLIWGEATQKRLAEIEAQELTHLEPRLVLPRG